METEDRKRKQTAEHQVKHILDKVVIPGDMIGLVMESFSTFEQRSEEVYGVRITEPEGSTVFLRGPSNQMAAAKQDFIENLPREYSYPIETSAMEWMQSHQEEDIQELRREYGVCIRFIGSNVIVLGMKKESCLRALRAIVTIARNEQGMRR